VNNSAATESPTPDRTHTARRGQHRIDRCRINFGHQRSGRARLAGNTTDGGHRRLQEISCADSRAPTTSPQHFPMRGCPTVQSTVTPTACYRSAKDPPTDAGTTNAPAQKITAPTPAAHTHKSRTGQTAAPSSSASPATVGVSNNAPAPAQPRTQSGPAHHTRRQQRVPAQFEEALISTKPQISRTSAKISHRSPR